MNSAEDLDEVDRLANHPVLRSVPLGCGVNHADLFRQREIGKLRKSRSVTGTETAAAGDGIRDDDFQWNPTTAGFSSAIPSASAWDSSQIFSNRTGFFALIQNFRIH